MRYGPALLLAALFLLVFSACGGSSSSPATDALYGVAGCWSVSIEELGVADFLLRVEERGTGYVVSIDGGPLRPVPVSDGRLVLPPLGGPNLAFGMDGERAAVFADVSHGANPQPGEPTGEFWAPFPVRRLAPSVYEEKAGAAADEHMRMELQFLYLALREWGERHDGAFPMPAEVARDAAFGRWLEREAAEVEVPWPTNPYTGGAMHAGAEPGDFVYAPEGDGFTLLGHLHDGTTFAAQGSPQ